MSFLKVRTHDGDTFRFELLGSSARIGRSGGNDLRLEDPRVSRVHATLENRGGDVYLIDQGSKAGTLVNERCVMEPTVLRTGDVLRMGGTTLVFEGSLAPGVELDDSNPLPENVTSLSLEETLLSQDLPGDAPDLEPGSLDRRDLRSFINEVDREMLVQGPLNELYQRALEIAHRVVPLERAALMSLENEQLVVRAQRAGPGATIDSTPLSRLLIEDVLGNRKAVLLRDVRDEKGSRHSVILAPLSSGHDASGILYVGRRKPFGQGHLELLTHLAHIVAIKIENKRLLEQQVRTRAMQQELRRAAEIQNQFLPDRAPRVDGYRLHGFNRPSFGVGGDFFNYFPFEDGRIAIVLGDVAGNGLPAALLMCSFQPLIRAVLDGSAPPGEAMDRLNSLLCRHVPVNRFITAFLGVLDTRDHTLTFSNAGQTAPLLLGPRGEVSRLAATGLPLGIIDDTSYGQSRVSIALGSTLVIYSDGLSEVADASEEEFGDERVQATAAQARVQPPEEIVNRLLQAAERHAGSDANEDDVTIVILQRPE